MIEIKTYKRSDVKAKQRCDAVRAGDVVEHVMDRRSLGTVVAHVLDRVAVVWSSAPTVAIKNEVGSPVGHVCC